VFLAQKFLIYRQLRQPKMYREVGSKLHLKNTIKVLNFDRVSNK
jgi:hypothetical protein